VGRRGGGALGAPPGAQAATPKKPARTVRHPRAIQRDRQPRPTGAPAAPAVAARLAALIPPAPLVPGAPFRALGLRARVPRGAGLRRAARRPSPGTCGAAPPRCARILAAVLPRMAARGPLLAGHRAALLALLGELPPRRWHTAAPYASDQGSWDDASAAVPAGAPLLVDLGSLDYALDPQRWPLDHAAALCWQRRRVADACLAGKRLLGLAPCWTGPSTASCPRPGRPARCRGCGARAPLPGPLAGEGLSRAVPLHPSLPAR
jgi:hypothetical protein